MKAISRKKSFRTKSRGLDVLNSPLLNKGTAFSLEERKALGLVGLLPPNINTLETQVRRAYIQYESLSDPLSRNLFLTAVHDRNQVLFYRLFSEHLREMIPVVNGLTVGLAIEQYRHEARRPSGVYLSIDHVEGIEDAFANLGLGADDVDLILATDAEQILGVGDWGVGGIEVSIGKLSIYTAAGGINPSRAIPVMLDSGTNRDSLLRDPMYVGNRHERVRGEQYDEFIDAYVKAVTKLFPNALLVWADLSAENGRRILAKYGGASCNYNDDIEGTGAISLAALISACRVCAVPMRNQRVVIFGAGAAGLAVAERISDFMVREGIPEEEAAKRFWFVDKGGLITTDHATEMLGPLARFARPASESTTWKHGSGIDLPEVVSRVHPTFLIGAAAQAGAFTEAIVRDMAAHTERPVIFAMCVPSSRAAALPKDLLHWTDGRALIATGSAFAPITHKGVTYAIAQLSNSILYPGLALGVIVSQARRITSGMLAAAAGAVSSLVAMRVPGASLLPHVDDLRSVSATVAAAVAEAAVGDGVAGVEMEGANLVDIVQRVGEAMWKPEYQTLIAG